MTSGQTPEKVEELAQKRAASRNIPYMQVLDNMVTDIWKNLMPEGPSRPYDKKPFPKVSEIKYGQALSFTEALDEKLFVWGNLRGNEVSFAKVSFDEYRPGRFIIKPFVDQHLENRKGIKPDQPKTQDDAEAEANWLYAAEMMRGVQTYVKRAKDPGMILGTYGIPADRFCINLQKYVWMFLGKGSTKGLPWGRDPAWPQSRWSNPNYPNLGVVKQMWHAGSDLSEIVQKIGPSSNATLISEDQDHEEDGNSLS